MIHTLNGLFDIDPEDIYIYIRNHMMGGRVFESHIINGTILPYIKKSKYVVDVGANIGCHAISYANYNPECKVWAFEPQEKLYEILSRNVILNNLSQRVKVLKSGVGHEIRTCTLSSLDKVYDTNYRGYNKGGLGIGEGGEK